MGFEQVCIMSHGTAPGVVPTPSILLIPYFCILTQLKRDEWENKEQDRQELDKPGKKDTRWGKKRIERGNMEAMKMQ